MLRILSVRNIHVTYVKYEQYDKNKYIFSKCLHLTRNKLQNSPDLEKKM